MRVSLTGGAAFLTLALMGGVAVAEPSTLKVVDFGDSQGLSTMVFPDGNVKFNGKSALKIKTAEPIKVRLCEAPALDVQDATLLCKADVKSENLKGAAYLEMWCEVNGGQYFSRGFDSTTSGTKDWKTIQTPFFLQKGQRITNVTVSLVVDGSGTVWVGDLALERK